MAAVTTFLTRMGGEPDLETVYRAQRAERSGVQQQASSSAAGSPVTGSRGAEPAMQPAPAEQRNGSAAHSRAGIAGPQRGSEQPGQGKSAAGAAATSAAPDAAAHEQQWETLTATDSDDDNDDGASSADSADFGTAYEQTLQHELAASRMGASFAKSGDASTGSAAAGASAAVAHACAKGKGRAAEGDREGNGANATRGDDSDEEELRPVDVDLNLVQNLLASYAGKVLGGPRCSCGDMIAVHGCVWEQGSGCAQTFLVVQKAQAMPHQAPQYVRCIIGWLVADGCLLHAQASRDCRGRRATWQASWASAYQMTRMPPKAPLEALTPSCPSRMRLDDARSKTCPLAPGRHVEC